MRHLSLMIMILLLAAPALAREPKIVGWVEQVTLAEIGSTVKAKMDTGAKTSSIDAEVIDIRKAGEKKRGKLTGEVVVFSVQTESGPKTFERAIHRYVRIKKKEGGYIRRPVIEMRFCIAGRMVKEEVNLANRENFIYPVLVGRNMMQHAGVAIDPSRTLLTRPNCKSLNDDD